MNSKVERIIGEPDLVKQDGVITNTNQSEYDGALRRLNAVKQAEAAESRIASLETKINTILHLMENFMINQRPNENAVKTIDGWVDKTTGELLVSAYGVFADSLEAEQDKINQLPIRLIEKEKPKAAEVKPAKVEEKSKAAEVKPSKVEEKPKAAEPNKAKA